MLLHALYVYPRERQTAHKDTSRTDIRIKEWSCCEQYVKDAGSGLGRGGLGQRRG